MTANEIIARAEAASRPRPASRPGPAKAPAGSFNRGAFFRLCRMLHAYLSAFAFLALIFFSATGLLIDHPEWLQSRGKERETKLVIPAAALAVAKARADPAPALAAAVGRLTPLVGAYKSGEVEDGEAAIRLEGVKGASTLVVDMASGATDVTVERSNPMTVIGDLHRGKNAGAAWRWVIDLSAVLVLALSVIGYVLFFSLRFRLRTSLILTGVSLGVLAAIFVFLTP